MNNRVRFEDDILSDTVEINYALFRGNYNRSEVLEGCLSEGVYTLLWKFFAYDEVFSSQVVFNGICLTTSLDGILYALDVYAGEELWRFVTGGPINSTPSYFDGRIYFGNSDDQWLPLCT